MYSYLNLLTGTAFRIAEILPGEFDDPVRCVLHSAEWLQGRYYEAISYAWGDPSIKVPLDVHDSVLDVTRNLYTALKHLRYRDRPRFIWVDAIW